MPGVTGRVLLVCKLKSGSGATTTCRELCAAALRAGQKVALIDLDGQAGLSRWWNRRTAGEGERPPAPDLLQLAASQIPGAATGLRGRYDLTVVNSPPSGSRDDPRRRRGVRPRAGAGPTDRGRPGRRGADRPAAARGCRLRVRADPSAAGTRVAGRGGGPGAAGHPGAGLRADDLSVGLQPSAGAGDDRLRGGGRFRAGDWRALHPGYRPA